MPPTVPAPPTLWPDALRTLGGIGPRVADHAWEATPLGPIDAWPTSLRVVVQTLLASRYPMLLAWGEALIGIYNDAYVPILGKRHPAALGASARDTWADVWDGVGGKFEQALRGGEATLDEALPFAMERNGYPEEAHFTFGLSPVYDDDGAPAGALVVCAEVTDQVVAERRLRLLRDVGARTAEAASPEDAARAALAALEGAPDVPFSMIYLCGVPGAPPEGFAHTGRVGIPEGFPLAPPALPSHAEGTPWHLPEGEPHRLVEGGDHFAGLPGGPLGTPPSQGLVLRLGGEGVLIAGVNPNRALDEAYRSFFDTLAEQTGATLRSARARAEEVTRAEALTALDRAKTAFFQNASHELRTPLTLLLGPLEEALDADDLPDAARENLTLAYRNARRLQRLANALLDLTRAEAGSLAAAYEPVDLGALTAELAGSFRSAVEHAGLRLRVEVEPLAEQAYVDPSMWETVVLNLLSNALKHTFEGEIRVTSRGRAGEAEVRVEDTGAGIPPDELPRLFERFHRVRGTASRTQEGAGIGLALVHEIVALHGGRLDVESALGEGSAFIVRLPLGAAHLPQDRVALTTRGPQGLSDAAQALREEAAGWGDVETEGPGLRLVAPLPRRPRILVADDNADLRAYLARILSASYEVEVVPDGEAALAAARARTPDLVLADVVMPRLDGLGLLAALRKGEATRAVPVVLLSARAGLEARAGGMEAGADDYLAKPFARRELKARVSALLDSARRREAAALREANAALESRVAERSADIVALTSTLVRAEQSERQRIADVLHEDIQQQLFGLGLKVHLLRASAPPALVHGLDHLEEILQHIVLTVRRLALQLSPPVLHGEGLEEALRWLAVQMEETHGLSVTVLAERGLPTPTESLRILVFQVARELLFNVVRHAGKAEAVVRLSDQQGHLTLQVEDDGDGFPTGVPPAPGAPGTGLERVREQLRFLGGTLVLTSTPGAGTRATVSLPLDPSSPEPFASPAPAAGFPR